MGSLGQFSSDRSCFPSEVVRPGQQSRVRMGTRCWMLRKGVKWWPVSSRGSSHQYSSLTWKLWEMQTIQPTPSYQGFRTPGGGASHLCLTSPPSSSDAGSGLRRPGLLKCGVIARHERPYEVSRPERPVWWFWVCGLELNCLGSIIILPLSYVILDPSLDLSVPRFPHLENADDNNSHED